MPNNIKAIMTKMGGDKPASTELLRYARNDISMWHCEAEEVSRSNLVEDGNDITNFPRINN